MIHKKVIYLDDEGFEFTFEPIESSLKIKEIERELCPGCKTELEHITIKKEDVFSCPKCKKEIERKKALKEKGFEARYLIQDDDPIDPREDENLGNMVCFHREYSLGDKHDLTSDMFNGWEEMYKYLKKEKKAIIILPIYLYDHSGLSIKVGSFYGLLSQGHAEFDSGQIGFIYCTKEDIKRIGITKSKAEKGLRQEVEIYNQYIQGDVYCLVKETYNKDKVQRGQDNIGNYFGYDEATRALETEI